MVVWQEALQRGGGQPTKKPALWRTPKEGEGKKDKSKGGMTKRNIGGVGSKKTGRKERKAKEGALLGVKNLFTTKPRGIKPL